MAIRLREFGAAVGWSLVCVFYSAWSTCFLLAFVYWWHDPEPHPWLTIPVHIFGFMLLFICACVVAAKARDAFKASVIMPEEVGP